MWIWWMFFYWTNYFRKLINKINNIWKIQISQISNSFAEKIKKLFLKGISILAYEIVLFYVFYIFKIKICLRKMLR